MALKISTALSLNTDFFMRNFYKENRSAIKTNDRKNFSNIELSFEDSRALSRAARRLMKNDYGSSEDEDTDIDDTTRSSIEAFVNVYNNALNTSKDTTDNDTVHYLRKIKSMTQKNADDLAEIGITLEKDGSLSINDELLRMADTSKVRKVFSSENDFTKTVWNLSKKLNTSVQNDIYGQVTGNGLRINITM